MTDEKIKMVKRTVKHKVVTYHVQSEGLKPDGSYGEITVEAQARRGTEIELRESEANLLGKHGAFFTEDELKGLSDAGLDVDDTAPPEPANDNAVDLAALSVEETTAWLSGSEGGRKPSIPQVLTAVNETPEDAREDVAKRVIEAENAVQGRDPRSTLVTPLQEFLDDEDED